MLYQTLSILPVKLVNKMPNKLSTIGITDRGRVVALVQSVRVLRLATAGRIGVAEVASTVKAVGDSGAATSWAQ